MHMISGISVLIHHLDGEPLGVGAAVGVGPRGVGPWPGRRQYVFFQFNQSITSHEIQLMVQPYQGTRVPHIRLYLPQAAADACCHSRKPTRIDSFPYVFLKGDAGLLAARAAVARGLASQACVV